MEKASTLEDFGGCLVAGSHRDKPQSCQPLSLFGSRVRVYAPCLSIRWEGEMSGRESAGPLERFCVYCLSLLRDIKHVSVAHCNPPVLSNWPSGNGCVLFPIFFFQMSRQSVTKLHQKIYPSSPTWLSLPLIEMDRRIRFCSSDTKPPSSFAQFYIWVEQQMVLILSLSDCLKWSLHDPNCLSMYIQFETCKPVCQYQSDTNLKYNKIDLYHCWISWAA